MILFFLCFVVMISFVVKSVPSQLDFSAHVVSDGLKIFKQLNQYIGKIGTDLVINILNTVAYDSRNIGYGYILNNQFI